MKWEDKAANLSRSIRDEETLVERNLSRRTSADRGRGFNAEPPDVRGLHLNFSDEEDRFFCPVDRCPIHDYGRQIAIVIDDVCRDVAQEMRGFKWFFVEM